MLRNRHVQSPPGRYRALLLATAGLALTLLSSSLAASEGAAAASGAAAPAPPGPELMRHWSRSCALCHVDGTAGAPRIGQAGEWQPRLAKGSAVLLRHTIEGFDKMPPLGYCMACEEEDFRALIDFMAGDSE